MLAGLADFDVKSLTNQSPFLKNLSIENDAYLKVIRQLKTNKSLSKVIENPETRAAFVNALRALAFELDEEE